MCAYQLCCALWTKKASQKYKRIAQVFENVFVLAFAKKASDFTNAFSNFTPKNFGHLDQPRPHYF